MKTKAIVLFSLGLVLASDSIARIKRVRTTKRVNSLTELKVGERALFVAGNGKLYPVTMVQADMESETGADISAIKNQPCDGEAFDGEDRKAAKITVASAKVEIFNSLNELLVTLPKDNVIGNKNIATGSKSGRVPDEQRNVRVRKAWLYTLAREGDEDYHTIIGSTPTYTTSTKFFNIEISGLPPAGSKSGQALKAVRTKYKNFFRLNGICKGGYVSDFPKPIEIDFTGSLFFDELHYQGQASIGHGNAKPNSYWEVHPVSDINFH